MAFRQITKFKRKYVPERITRVEPTPVADSSVQEVVAEPKKNNTRKKKETMNEKVNKAVEIMDNMMAEKNVKVVKKDRGLIERTESSKIVLTEDNRQVLND